MLANKKVYVGKFSREIQEKAFKLGWKWRGKSAKIENTKQPFLYFCIDKAIRYDHNVKAYNHSNFEEVTPEWILSLEEPKTIKKTIRDLYPLSGFRVREDGTIYEVQNISPHHSHECWDILPTKEEAEAYKILPFLLQWRDKYNEGWKPDWRNDDEAKHCIEFYRNQIETYFTYCTSNPFSFKTAEIRDKFLEDFREELEIVKPLL